MNVIVVFPERTVTLAGTFAAAVLELVRVTTMPLVGAVPETVTVPVTVVVALPLTDVGDSVTDTSVGGRIVSVTVLLLEPSVAVIVALVDVETAFVAIVNVPLELPAGIVIDDGTVADAELEVSFTMVAALPAALSVTVAVALTTPVTLTELIVRLLI